MTKVEVKKIAGPEDGDSQLVLCRSAGHRPKEEAMISKTDKDMGATELWGLYMTLLKAEGGFRMLKGTLGLRPNFHQLGRRVEAHPPWPSLRRAGIFISVLAYHLLCWVRHHMDRAGDPRGWKTLRRLLRTRLLASTRLPLEDGRIVTVRKPGLPGGEIRAEGHGDFVVPLRSGPWFYRGGRPPVRNLG